MQVMQSGYYMLERTPLMHDKIVEKSYPEH